MGIRDFQRQLKQLEKINQTEKDATLNVANIPTDYDVLMIACLNDVNAIRALPTRAERNDYKLSRFLPKWLPFVEAYFEKGILYQNDYLVYCIVYLLDCLDFDRALPLVEKAIEQNQAMPKGWTSTLPTFCADQVYQWADKTASAGLSVEPYFSQLLEKIITKWSLHELIVAKWLKFAAALLIRTKDGEVKAAGIDDTESLVFAVQLCQRAQQLNHKAGVKNMIERCVMRLNALTKSGDIPPHLSPTVASVCLGEISMFNIEDIIRKLNARPPYEQGGENV